MLDTFECCAILLAKITNTKEIDIRNSTNTVLQSKVTYGFCAKVKPNIQTRRNKDRKITLPETTLLHAVLGTPSPLRQQILVCLFFFFLFGGH